MQIDQGQVVGLLGSNGAGKTTLIRLLVGLLRPTSGHIQIYGKTVGMNPSAVPIGYIPQFAPAFPGMTARDLIEFVLVSHGYWGRQLQFRTNEVIDQLEMELFAKRLIWDMSGGETRMTLLAAAISFKPQILVLDEPTAGLDSVARKRFWTLLNNVKNEWKPTILLVTHDINSAEQVIDQAILLRSGNLIFSGGIEELRLRFSPHIRCEAVTEISPGADWLNVSPGRWQITKPQDCSNELFDLAQVAYRAGAAEVTIGTLPLEDLVIQQG